MELRTFFAQNLQGDALAQASVTVYETGTTTLATIYDAAGSAKANPFQATSTGAIVFAAPNGVYDIVVQENGGTATQQIDGVRFFDPANQVIRVDDIQDAGTAARENAGAFATAAQGAKADGALQAANNLQDLPDAPSARGHLGLGSAALSATTDFAPALAKVPAGAVFALAKSSPPAGFLECDGAALSRSTYANLFNAIGTVFGAGDGSTTFNIPDLRGEFVRGWDNARGADSGRGFGTWQGDAIRNIYGELIYHANSTATNMQNENGVFGRVGTNNNFRRGGVEETGASSVRTTTFDASSVVPTADQNRPRNVALMHCIKY
ncbi:phage tail protein [Sediminimonas qiaohouensis]|uniref:phage tail protein n=1 Tax=Sediminimonas qiaohouensis TaxID=552061 RepID=UPI00040E9FDF|nr:phage tail protein [Sediminimonas qiaohouensis]